MTELLYRITVKDATFSGPIAGQTVVTGYIVSCEPETPAKREIVRPVAPDEPDTEIEVGYSRNAFEPLTVVYRKRKVELTKTLYILFRYINDLYRAEGKTAFDFAELSEVLTGDDCKMGKTALVSLIRRLAFFLSKIIAPISLTYSRETLYVVNKFVNQN